MKLVKRLTDNYKKNPESNIAKLLSIVDFEINAITETLKTIESYRMIDNAVGVTLDNIGKNVLLPRGSMDDVVYRLFLKTKIKANLSGGQIETINEIMTVLIEDHYLGLHEVWDNALYSNEPAAFEIRYTNFISKILEQYQFVEDDPYFLNGVYFLDGVRNLDGGLTFSYDSYNAEILAAINEIIRMVDFIKAAGVESWWCEVLGVETLINIVNNVTISLGELCITDVSPVNDVTMSEAMTVENGASFQLDGLFLLDGGAYLDGNRDFIVNDVTITEVAA